MSKEALPGECALSRARGEATAPKDFDWVQKNIPCQAACPAGTDIPGYLDAIAHGEYAQAYRINLQDNVFPGVLGRVCTRPCEPPCRHGWEGLGEPVAICFSKRSAADQRARAEPVLLDPVFPSTGKSVGVIGAGAAGLAAARELRLWGHDVTVYERYRIPGGLMVQGIPAFRLPRDVVSLEIEQIQALGVTLRCGVEIGKTITVDQLLAEHDAVVLATGTHVPFIPDTPGRTRPGVRHGLDFLKDFNTLGTVPVGSRVVVIGGGFTAVDCARVARRAGAESVSVYYRRSEAEMYIGGHEVVEMKQEGIAFHPLTAPLAYCGPDEDGAVDRIQLAPTRLCEPGADGRRVPEIQADAAFEVEADTVLLATGQVRDLEHLGPTIQQACAAAPRDGSTANPQLFMAGDVALGALSLIDAIGHAKACARRVDRHLMERDRWRDIVWIEDAQGTGRTREMDEIPRHPMPVRPPEERGVIDEVETGFDEDHAQAEAQRCYLCHYKYEIDNDCCIYCDRCLKVKPVENCIVKVSALQFDEAGRITGYDRTTSAENYNLLYIDQNECIRCGACAEVCPVECIPLQKVQTRTVPVKE